MSEEKTPSVVHPPIAQAMQTSLALHTLGWKAFQDLCAQVCEVVLNQPVAIYREAQDGGQDATFVNKPATDGRVIRPSTIQCKFSGDATRRLRISDIASERNHILDLVSKGLAYSYYFITNMGVDAPIAAEIKAEFYKLGVKDPQVFGREWLTVKIRESSRLRALVPRIYGLGDLSMILDQRRAEQTEALLGHLMPSLRTYVPTNAHRKAVRVLGETGIVLLVGAPATGKSMIAAILATTALGGEGHQTFQLDGPGELTEFWNPNESGRFYWIDDAFGPNQLRDDYIDQWVVMMNKVKTALNAGNRFVLTSRQHIWRAAKPKLGIRNHHKLSDESAVVNVGLLSPDEREQIVYNHVKNGNQSIEWKSQLKPYLNDICKSSDLLPEIARRLGDSSYTEGIKNLPSDLNDFVLAPKEFLKDTLRELADAQRAALTVIFMFRAKLPVNTNQDARFLVVCEKYGVKEGDVRNALAQLDGSFIVQKQDGSSRVWTFAHPTISDALADILKDRPDLLELYIEGARVETLLSEAVCEGENEVTDAIVIPASKNNALAARIVEAPDEIKVNTALFSFLAFRASDPVLKMIAVNNPDMLRRDSAGSWRMETNGRVKTMARFKQLNVLPEDLRESIAQELEDAIFNRQDSSVFQHGDLLSLFSVHQLLALPMKIYEDLVINMTQRIEAMVDDADLTIEPSDNFDELKEYIQNVDKLFSNTSIIEDAIFDLDIALSDGVETVRSRKEAQNESTDWDGEDIEPDVIEAPTSGRSIFSDIDL